VQYLTSKRFQIFLGGYDNAAEENEAAILEYIRNFAKAEGVEDHE
jgi:hypothetical protein